ncbi:putative atypical dual specificity phosphatase [Monocercomonoides exilis]|uniref:putative atypical dual specificity phosphatase n=1 Tax=Monocercomonoides exilis TaxID=2049356 RepID=UPI00355A1882|nr:putative atypical dual specificity phosphatase [Monocercomonoides exilis]|eukprot:MONOS_454.1-p1 / transcript=MONOS_454.1 / gene=MONOS_454 / organism=Monocercomonoides_exilis_PA203 / gene_product=unspecified product / transcript_product=unspecified product / location=Mono_scaffold00007:143408-149113(-) / protein_length=1842 / sequence_SO=supercontig / SO=protein_coding / is_pseudo=false
MALFSSGKLPFEKEHHDKIADISRITAHIFVGNQIAANDKNILKMNGIDTIVRLRTQPSLSMPDCVKTVVFCQVEDLSVSNIIAVLEPAFTALKATVERNGRCLVHCHAGKSRSPAVVIAFLMKTYHVSLSVAYRHVERARNGLAMNPTFKRQLCDYEFSLYGKRSMQFCLFCGEFDCRCCQFGRLKREYFLEVHQTLLQMEKQKLGKELHNKEKVADEAYAEKKLALECLKEEEEGMILQRGKNIVESERLQREKEIRWLKDKVKFFTESVRLAEDDILVTLKKLKRVEDRQREIGQSHLRQIQRRGVEDVGDDDPFERVDLHADRERDRRVREKYGSKIQLAPLAQPPPPAVIRDEGERMLDELNKKLIGQNTRKYQKWLNHRRLNGFSIQRAEEDEDIGKLHWIMFALYEVMSMYQFPFEMAQWQMEMSDRLKYLHPPANPFQTLLARRPDILEEVLRKQGITMKAAIDWAVKKEEERQLYARKRGMCSRREYHLPVSTNHSTHIYDPLFARVTDKLHSQTQLLPHTVREAILQMEREKVRDRERQIEAIAEAEAEAAAKRACGIKVSLPSSSSFFVKDVSPIAAAPSTAAGSRTFATASTQSRSSASLASPFSRNLSSPSALSPYSPPFIPRKIIQSPFPASQPKAIQTALSSPVHSSLPPHPPQQLSQTQPLSQPQSQMSVRSDQSSQISQISQSSQNSLSQLSQLSKGSLQSQQSQKSQQTQTSSLQTQELPSTSSHPLNSSLSMHLRHSSLYSPLHSQHRPQYPSKHAHHNTLPAVFQSDQQHKQLLSPSDRSDSPPPVLPPPFLSRFSSSDSKLSSASSDYHPLFHPYDSPHTHPPYYKCSLPISLPPPISVDLPSPIEITKVALKEAIARSKRKLLLSPASIYPSSSTATDEPSPICTKLTSHFLELLSTKPFSLSEIPLILKASHQFFPSESSPFNPYHPFFASKLTLTLTFPAFAPSLALPSPSSEPPLFKYTASDSVFNEDDSPKMNYQLWLKRQRKNRMNKKTNEKKRGRMRRRGVFQSSESGEFQSKFDSNEKAEWEKSDESNAVEEKAAAKLTSMFPSDEKGAIPFKSPLVLPPPLPYFPSTTLSASAALSSSADASFTATFSSTSSSASSNSSSSSASSSSSFPLFSLPPTTSTSLPFSSSPLILPPPSTCVFPSTSLLNSNQSVSAENTQNLTPNTILVKSSATLSSSLFDSQDFCAPKGCELKENEDFGVKSNGEEKMGEEKKKEFVEEDVKSKMNSQKIKEKEKEKGKFIEMHKPIRSSKHLEGRRGKGRRREEGGGKGRECEDSVRDLCKYRVSIPNERYFLMNVSEADCTAFLSLAAMETFHRSFELMNQTAQPPRHISKKRKKRKKEEKAKRSRKNERQNANENLRENEKLDEYHHKHMHKHHHKHHRQLGDQSFDDEQGNDDNKVILPVHHHHHRHHHHHHRIHKSLSSPHLHLSHHLNFYKHHSLLHKYKSHGDYSLHHTHHKHIYNHSLSHSVSHSLSHSLSHSSFSDPLSSISHEESEESIISHSSILSHEHSVVKHHSRQTVRQSSDSSSPQISSHLHHHTHTSRQPDQQHRQHHHQHHQPEQQQQPQRRIRSHSHDHISHHHSHKHNDSTHTKHLHHTRPLRRIHRSHSFSHHHHHATQSSMATFSTNPPNSQQDSIDAKPAAHSEFPSSAPATGKSSPVNQSLSFNQTSSSFHPSYDPSTSHSLLSSSPVSFSHPPTSSFVTVSSASSSKAMIQPSADVIVSAPSATASEILKSQAHNLVPENASLSAKKQMPQTSKQQNEIEQKESKEQIVHQSEQQSRHRHQHTHQHHHNHTSLQRQQIFAKEDSISKPNF